MLNTFEWHAPDSLLPLQMVGRAGRPQFDTEGVAVIMTQKPVR